MTNSKYIPLHEIADSLGSVSTGGLLLFHSLTGCDSTGGFFGIGKKTGWKIYKDDVNFFGANFIKLLEKDFSEPLLLEEIKVIE